MVHAVLVGFLDIGSKRNLIRTSDSLIRLHRRGRVILCVQGLSWRYPGAGRTSIFSTCPATLWKVNQDRRVIHGGVVPPPYYIYYGFGWRLLATTL